MDPHDSRASRTATIAAYEANCLDHPLFNEYRAKRYGDSGLKPSGPAGPEVTPVYHRVDARPRRVGRFRSFLAGLGLVAREPAPPGPWALQRLSHPTAPQLDLSPAYVHPYGCDCPSLDRPCTVSPTASQVEVCAMLELSSAPDGSCPGCKLSGTIFHRHGLAKCVEVALWTVQQDHTPIADSFSRNFFQNSPQEHAVLNRHLLDYFRGRANAQRSTPYNIPTSQRHLLQALGMEEPQPDAPEAPHALHKSIEEFQLSRMADHLPANGYGLVSVKAAKTHLLPPPASLQQPVHQAKDVSRYPGSQLRCANFDQHDVYFMHDVSSEVGPHEIVERLSASNPKAHVFLTGINPVEVVDRTSSFEPSSHEIDYDLDKFNFVFTGSESEAYFTPIGVTVSWLKTSSIKASDGTVYQVVLLEYKLGHCLWHVFPGELSEQDCRTFSTGSYVLIPAVLTGTWSDEWLPTKLVSAVLSFTDRTPDLSTRNLSAKISQLATSVTPRLTSREMWVACHLARERAPVQTWSTQVSRFFWRSLYAVTFQWHLLAPRPDVYTYLDERRRYRTIYPTRGGGWSAPHVLVWKPDSIPNKPSWLQRLSAFTGAAFSFVLPKLLIGEVLSHLFFHVPLAKVLSHLVSWADLQPLRVALTLSIVVVTAILPGHVIKIFTRLAGHYWRQLWLPGWFSYTVHRAIAEVCGAPGATLFCWLPGRGWFMQAYLWAVALLSVMPGLVPHFILPWVAVYSPLGWVLALWWLFILAENAFAYVSVVPFCHSLGAIAAPPSYGLSEWWFDFYHSDYDRWSRPLLGVLGAIASHRAHRLLSTLGEYANRASSWYTPVPPGRRGFEPLPARAAAEPVTPRVRNVDRVLPPVTVLPNRIPVAPGAPGLAVDPVGMRFHEWLAALKTAYAAEPNRYALLTPGQSCFWDCVSSLGGTAHMWFSWYMAFSGQVPDPNDVVGQVTQADVLKFSSASRLGFSITGSTSLVTQSQDSWPVLNLVMSYHASTGLYHVELSQPVSMDASLSSLARILCTLRNRWPQWFNVQRNAIALSAVDSLPSHTPVLRAMAGTHTLPLTRSDCLDALTGSYSCTPIDPFAQEGFAVDFMVAHNQALELVEFNQPASVARIGVTGGPTLWARFRMAQGTFRAKVPKGYSHPLAETRDDADPPAKIGASAASERTWRNNVAPQPPRWMELQSELGKVVAPYVDQVLPAVPLAAEELNYTADVNRASRLVADLRAHPAVLESFAHPQVVQSLDSVVDTWRASGESRSVKVVAYLGVWGCGKTTATLDYMKTLTLDERRNTRVVSHTESLRAQAKLAIDFPEMRGYNFPTLASIIAEPSTGTIIFDDAGKFWGGMLDLVILCNPFVHTVVVNGDPAQGYAHFPHAGTQSRYDAGPLEAISGLVTRYATVTHRGFRVLADTLGVHTTSRVEGHLTHTVGPKIGLPVLTTSPRYAENLAEAGRRAYTFSGVQGEDFSEEVEVDVTALEDALLDRTAYVGLTRSKTGCYVHLNAMDPSSSIRAPPTASDVMNALVYAIRSQGGHSLVRPDAVLKAAFYRHLHLSMPSLAWFAKIGASVPRGEYQSVFPAVFRDVAVETAVDEPGCVEVPCPVAPPVDTYIRETHWTAKEYREVPGRGGATDQFKDLAFVNPHEHKRSDTATYFMSVQKRLKAQSSKANARRMARCLRSDMCKEYDRLVPRPPQWSALKHSEYCDLAVEEYEKSRSQEAVRAKLDAHDPDRTGSDIVISLKNQVIRKAEKRSIREAVPGQLIHEYDLSQTLADAPYALFLENEVLDAFPDNFLFYRRMSPEKFISAYQRRWRVGNGVHTSDVTRWDVGCDAGVLNFDVHVMHRSGFPSDYIVSYIERRLNSRSQHGPMGTMQNSGDRYTWILNSIRRAIVASIVNSLTPADTTAINGDDEATDRYCESKHFSDSPWAFKNANGPVGEFSGFELGGKIPTYSAEGIHYRTLILESRDPSNQEKWSNYMGLLGLTDLDSPLAMDVARSAFQFMKPDLFWQFLPTPLRQHFV